MKSGSRKSSRSAGVASRRKAEQMITEGRVTVNGTIITELGSKADLERDHIKVDGKLLRMRRKLVYIALNKPKAYVTTVSDPQGRDTVMDLVKGVKERVYPGGTARLSQRRAAAAYQRRRVREPHHRRQTHVQKTYVVKVTGEIIARAGEAVSRRRTPAWAGKRRRRRSNC